MKTLLVLLLAGALALLSGCASIEKTLNDLPQVSAAEIHAETSNPLATASLDAVNLQQTPTQATADLLTVRVSGTFIGTSSVIFKGYVRDKRLPVVAPPPPRSNGPQ